MGAQIASEHGWPHAVVAYADFSTEDVRPQLDRLARYPLVRGVRMQLHWHTNPLYRFAARPDLCADPLIRRNMARLADYGWSFDLQVFAPQMADAAGLAEACPGVTFILQHAGMLEDLSPEGRAAWRAGMTRLAACPNVVRKLSALGTFIRATIPPTLPPCSPRNRCAIRRRALYSAQRSRSYGPATATWWRPISASRRSARTSATRFSGYRHARHRLGLWAD
jgi:predicted TIM-barrel fold metal-dependent hydrolase